MNQVDKVFHNNIDRMKNKKKIAIIPARSGSKGLIDKNIKLLNGKPLLSYSIEAAIESNLFDTVHVSTDSPHYADIAADYGAEVPFLRDAISATDTSSSWDVVREVLKKYVIYGKLFEDCVLLQPTSPLRTARDIISAYELFETESADSLTSVCELDHPVQWSFRLDKGCYMSEFAASEYRNCRRQELDKYYRENGAIYIVKTQSVLNMSFDFYSDRCVAYIMERGRSVDIDTLQDFYVAEAILKSQMGES